MAEKLQGYARNNIIIGYLAVLLTSIEKFKPLQRRYSNNKIYFCLI